MQLDKIKTKMLGKRIKYFKEIPSTHIYAKELVTTLLDEKKETENIVIIADKQTKGIGTKGRNWYTGSGKNIAMTIILTPKCQIKQLENLTYEIAESMQKVILDLYNIKLEIKEPNDLMLNNKKIGGILTEINTIGEKINYLLISIGFNVNEEMFSKEVENIATSLKKEYNEQDFSRQEIIVRFLEQLEEMLLEKKIEL